MYVGQLRSFCAVVEHGSYTQAARELHLTQPALSQHVRSLERTYGVTLLKRTGGRMKVTEAGEVMYRRGVEILAQLVALREEIEGTKRHADTRVSIGAGIGIGNYLLPPVLARFRRRYPRVEVDMRVGLAPTVFELVRSGKVDLGIALEHQVPAGLLTVPLYQERIVLVVAPGHPILRRWPTGVPFEALADLPLIAHPAATSTIRPIWEQRLRQEGVEPRVELEFETNEPIKQVIGEGIGAAFLLSSSVGHELDARQLEITPLKGHPILAQFVLARVPHRAGPPALRDLLHMLISRLEGDRNAYSVNRDAVAQLIPDKRFSRSQPRYNVTGAFEHTQQRE